MGDDPRELIGREVCRFNETSKADSLADPPYQVRWGQGPLGRCPFPLVSDAAGMRPPIQVFDPSDRWYRAKTLLQRYA